MNTKLLFFLNKRNKYNYVNAVLRFILPCRVS